MFLFLICLLWQKTPAAIVIITAMIKLVRGFDSVTTIPERISIEEKNPAIYVIRNFIRCPTPYIV